ncbi:hypothetical protein Pmani_027337, partial [Petrolisthes manimaculis]
VPYLIIFAPPTLTVTNFILNSLPSSSTLCLHPQLFAFILNSCLHPQLFAFILNSLPSSSTLCPHPQLFALTLNSLPSPSTLCLHSQLFALILNSLPSFSTLCPHPRTPPLHPSPSPTAKSEKCSRASQQRE